MLRWFLASKLAQNHPKVNFTTELDLVLNLGDLLSTFSENGCKPHDITYVRGLKWPAWCKRNERAMVSRPLYTRA